MPRIWTALVALAATLLLLLLVRRWITHRLQELGMRWTGDPDVSLVLYFVLMLPGVILHELSHVLVALVLGVGVRNFSIGPARAARTGRVSLGSVQVGKVDPLRGSLIGLAPLLAGSAAILLIGFRVLGVGELSAAFSSEGAGGVLDSLRRMMGVADVALWVYLIFAVSNAMLPSESDLGFVRPVLLFIGLVTVLVLVLTGVPAIPDGVQVVVSQAAGYLAYAFGVTLAVDLVFMLIIGLSLAITRRVRQGAG